MAYNHWERIFSAISWFKIPLVSRAELDFLALEFIELQFDMLLLIICQSWILIQSVHIYLCTMTNVYKVTTTRRRKSMVHITNYLNYMFVLQQFWSWHIFMFYCLHEGLRPEKLAVFDEECWTLMQECWEGDPMRRPLLGNVQKRLQDLLSTYKKTQAAKAKTQQQSKPLTRRIPSSGSRSQFVSW